MRDSSSEVIPRLPLAQNQLKTQNAGMNVEREKTCLRRSFKYSSPGLNTAFPKLGPLACILVHNWSHLRIVSIPSDPLPAHVFTPWRLVLVEFSPGQMNVTVHQSTVRFLLTWSDRPIVWSYPCLGASRDPISTTFFMIDTSTGSLISSRILEALHNGQGQAPCGCI